MKIGCCIDCKDIMAAIEAGCEFIDLSGQELMALSLDEIIGIKRRLEQHCVPCIGVHAIVPPGIRLAGEGYSALILKNYFHALAERSQILEIQYWGIGSPASRALTADFPIDRADDQMRRTLEMAADAYPAGKILLESLNPQETNYINSIIHAACVIEPLDASRVGLVMDVYHHILCGERHLCLNDDILNRIEYMHIADPLGRRFPSEDMDPAIMDFAIQLAQASGTKAIAIEAKTTDFFKDCQRAFRFIQEKIQDDQREGSMC